MPDFNKGDFTQQGVAGHVNANLRLNEKRLVNIDLTSNEEAEGCTISGAVTDLLNNEVYPIGAGVSGNIEITENGENINVAPYATATVNVAGGGSSYTELEFTDNTTDEVYESVLTIGEIISASANGTLGFMKTDSNLVGAIGVISNVPYVITAIYENEDTPGTYDIIIVTTEYIGLNTPGHEIFKIAEDPSNHLVLSYTK